VIIGISDNTDLFFFMISVSDVPYTYYKILKDTIGLQELKQRNLAI
jgi:hypothetical protein